MIPTTPKYWFRAKRYGWGWGLPIAWQGWAVLITWLVVFSLGVRSSIPRRTPAHFAFAAGMVAPLILLCYWKGEPAKWRWGDGSPK
jgi:hypothetical protein